MTHTNRLIALSLALLALTGCGGSDGVGVPEAPGTGGLSLTEATELVGALTGQVPFFSAPAVGPPARQAAQAIDTTSILTPISFSNPCAAGGTVSATGSDSLVIITDDGNVQSNPQVVTSNWSGRQRLALTYNNCGVTGSQGVWTVNGSPGLAYDFDLSGQTAVTIQSANGVPTTFDVAISWDVTGSWSGILDWAQGGRSGQCAFNMQWAQDYQATNGQGGGQVVVSGTACGVSVSQTQMF